MKLVVCKLTNRITHIFEDNVTLEVTDKLLITPDFIVANYGTDYCDIIENVDNNDIPSDWIGGKYLRQNHAIVPNADWGKKKVVKPRRRKLKGNPISS